MCTLGFMGCTLVQVIKHGYSKVPRSRTMPIEHFLARVFCLVRTANHLFCTAIAFHVLSYFCDLDYVWPCVMFGCIHIPTYFAFYLCEPSLTHDHDYAHLHVHVHQPWLFLMWQRTITNWVIIRGQGLSQRSFRPRQGLNYWNASADVILLCMGVLTTLLYRCIRNIITILLI